MHAATTTLATMDDDDLPIRAHRNRRPHGTFFSPQEFCRFTADDVKQIDDKDLTTAQELYHRDRKIFRVRLNGVLAPLSAPAAARHPACELTGTGLPYNRPSLPATAHGPSYLQKVANHRPSATRVKVKVAVTRGISWCPPA